MQIMIKNQELNENSLPEKLLESSFIWLSSKLKQVDELRQQKQAQSEFEIPNRFGKYKIISSLGKGKHGMVYRALNPNTDSEVALKVLSRNIACSPAGIPRFELEAKLASKINHPNMVRVLDAGFDEYSASHFIISEFVDGGNLTEIMACSGGCVPIEIAIDITIFVAKVLNTIHEKGIVHRDIKPANIVVSKTGEVKLTDLGTAKLVEENTDLTQTGNILGTASYISPEQVDSSKNVDSRTDIYSLGAIMFHLVSGAPPFKGNNDYEIVENIVKEPTPHLCSTMPNIPANVAGIIYEMMAKNVVDRFQSIHELLPALLKVREPEVQAAPEIKNPAAPMPIPIPVGNTAPIPKAKGSNQFVLKKKEEEPPPPPQKVLPILGSVDDM